MPAFVLWGKREPLILALRKFQYTSLEIPDEVFMNSGRQLNDAYQEKLVRKVCFHFAGKLFLPAPLRKAVILWKAVHYLKEGWKSIARRKLEVAVLDASAIGISVLRSDFSTALSVMFLLGVGEILEEWTHKKSVGDLARSMALNTEKVWLKSGEQEVLVYFKKIEEGDHVIVRMGSMIFPSDMKQVAVWRRVKPVFPYRRTSACSESSRRISICRKCFGRGRIGFCCEKSRGLLAV